MIEISGTFTCQSLNKMHEQFKKGDFINHSTGEKYPEMFVNRVMKITGL